MSCRVPGQGLSLIFSHPYLESRYEVYRQNAFKRAENLGYGLRFGIYNRANEGLPSVLGSIGKFLSANISVHAMQVFYYS